MRETLLSSCATPALALMVLSIQIGCDAMDPTIADEEHGELRSLVAPTLYRAPDQGSPVRADPGDLLLIPGVGFSDDVTVVYQAISNTTQALGAPPPAGTPTAAQGRLTPMRVDANAVTVRLPAVMTAGQSYALWVIGAGGASPGILINDARPMWISPAMAPASGASPYPFLYVNADRPGLTREVKLVGRNLQPAPGQKTRVRFTGIHTTLTLDAANDGDPATEIERYAATVTLPKGLPAGDYSVAVSRDGVSWVRLDAQAPSFSILPDPVHAGSYDVSLFGSGPSYPCSPNDAIDDTYCITRAIHYADAHGGGDVVFPLGTWRLDVNVFNQGSEYPGVDSYVFASPPGSAPAPGTPVTKYDVCPPLWSAVGLTVPKGVNLIGLTSGGKMPTIETHQAFDQPYLDLLASQALAANPPRDPTLDTFLRQYMFSLNGSNVVRGLRFHDTYKPMFSNTGVHGAISPGAKALVLLGDDITVSDSFFDDTYTGIMGYWPHELKESRLARSVIGNRGLVVTNNTFAVYDDPLHFEVLEDAVVADNLFFPGATEAPIALGTSGSYRVDISGNEVDGAETSYSGDSLGWRAGIFLPNTTSHERVLIADNSFACIGTRRGFDGEAISTDTNQDLWGFRSGQWVTASSPTKVRVSPQPGDTLLSVKTGQFEGRWLRVDYGPGLGQARKIISAIEDPNGIDFLVAPAFDVPPVPQASRVIVSEQTWQLAIVDNTIDNTCSLSLPDYKNLHWNGGLINLYGSTADSAIESNEQLYAQGIFVYAQYGADLHSAYNGYQSSHYFVEVRGNSIEGSFGGINGKPNPQDYSGSGIELMSQIKSLDEKGDREFTPDYMAFGLSIGHNTIHNAALAEPNNSNNVWSLGISTGGALADEVQTPAYVDTLVFGNLISAMPQPWYPIEAWRGWPQGKSLTIANGESSPSFPLTGQDYPQNTTICDTNLLQGGAGSIGNFPGQQVSSMKLCP